MGRASGLWLLLPQEALPLLLVGGAVLVMFGIASIRTVLGALIVFALTPIFSPIVEALFGALPAWLALLCFVGLGFWCVQAIATTVMGRGAAEHMVGSLAADLVRFVLKSAFLPVRLVWRLITR